ncbi:dihydroxyacetone kinase subunit DhaK [Swaminathania salitolerans]|uniref:Dihydroxyacetone kinase n=1 Tax=Swaminathania salitolerans TaxID=182838 RepID=A0A511BRM7_9PROT|nr:dihydroxyacetone kinase subunit DhaK [Swaminathania salitolerans]GBQ14337.1 dihydroxyacetone kinase [Swaminathania salitolerans LMG 21291]GEL02997.1 dihydroxyacetone kinase [Swaminathania salitolerans]
MKRFFNRRETIVAEGIEGLLRSSYGAELCRLDGQDDLHVVLRKDWSHDKVAILSGGGSGHEPAHAGFVGKGMLTGAVCGALFASPGVDAILAAICAVTGEAGCLLVVKNYTGDRLNFGIAAEQAKALGYRVELVIVGDDIALGRTDRARGIAGTVLVHKIAGAAAEAGLPLETVAALAGRVASSLFSLGLALSDCNVYTPDQSPRLGDDEAELGLGIHGEAGVERIPLACLDDLVARTADKLMASLPRDEDLVIMLNMLGSVPPIEACALVEGFSRTALAQRARWIVGPAPLMTALDMNGFSLTALPATPDFVAFLEAPATPFAWPGVAPFGPAATCPAPTLPQTFRDPASEEPFTHALITRGAEILIDRENALNALDARCGDGDAGSTFADAARQILRVIDRLPLASPDLLAATLGRLLARHSGGSSGVLLSILLTTTGSDTDWRRGLRKGVGKMQDYGGARPGDRTMLDALLPAIDALESGASIGEAAQAARKGADSTRGMTARAGRASYIPPEQLADIPDPGAEAIALLFEALAQER